MKLQDRTELQEIIRSVLEAVRRDGQGDCPGSAGGTEQGWPSARDRPAERRLTHGGFHSSCPPPEPSPRRR